MMAELLLQVYSVDDSFVVVPLESAICLSLVTYLSPVDLSLVFVAQTKMRDHLTASLTISTSHLQYRLVDEASLTSPVKDCCLPVFTNNDQISCVAGLCATLRQVVKVSKADYKGLLGFREGCLVACAEFSLWSRFCEVDLIQTTRQVLQSSLSSDSDVRIDIPPDLGRFEMHLTQPVRSHNIRKLESTEHRFSEGPIMSLADLIIAPCIRIIMQIIGSSSIGEYLPLTVAWLQNVVSEDNVQDALNIIAKVPSRLPECSDVNYVLPSVSQHSLYKSDPKRYKPRSKIFTRQEDLDACLCVIDELALSLDYESAPFGQEISLSWNAVPSEVIPTVPSSRVDRKTQQLENLAKAVIKLAQPGDTVVDFCCGSGHLGIVLAHFLPCCSVILVDNKEESLVRARSRVSKLCLTNICIIQTNLDYFKGNFQVGVSLHACGIASDLVISSCLERRASFIVCPCCYGSLQANHMVSYPRSELLRSSGVTGRDLLVLGHCADQTHAAPYAKSEQGERCMRIVDTDRCLAARDVGYQAMLAKLVPPSCTPKHNLLVGWPLC